MGSSFMVEYMIGRSLEVGMGKNWLGLVDSYKYNRNILSWSLSLSSNLMYSKKQVGMGNKLMVQSLKLNSKLVVGMGRNR
jgi:hypothetical protein